MTLPSSAHAPQLPTATTPRSASVAFWAAVVMTGWLVLSGFGLGGLPALPWGPTIRLLIGLLAASWLIDRAMDLLRLYPYWQQVRHRDEGAALALAAHPAPVAPAALPPRPVAAPRLAMEGSLLRLDQAAVLAFPPELRSFVLGNLDAALAPPATEAGFDRYHVRLDGPRRDLRQR